MTDPLDKSENLLTKDMIFAWDSAPDADRYTLKIATDVEMKDIVVEKSVLGNITIVNGLSSGQTRYYWTVEAENLSKQIGNKKLSKGEPFTFTTTPFDTLDKAELQVAIDFAEYTMESMVEGDEAGRYVFGTKDQLQELLDEANALNGLDVGRQNDVVEIISRINHFIETISKYMNKGYIGIGHMLNSDDWYVVNENSVIVEDEILKVGLTGNNNTTTYMKEDMHGAVINCFQMRVDFSGGWGAGFSLNQTGDPGLIWDGKLKANGYLILFKQDIIELQRYVDGKQTEVAPGSGTILTAENTGLKDKEWAEIQAGAIDVADGVMIVLKVNGETMFKVLDANPPTKLGAKFTLNNFVSGADNGLQIKNSDNIPTTDLMSDIGYPEDTTPPFITVRGLVDGITTHDSNLSFTVAVTDDVDEAIMPEVTMNGQLVEESSGAYLITLNEGDNSITIVAKDHAGNSSSETFVVTYTPFTIFLLDEMLENGWEEGCISGAGIYNSLLVKTNQIQKSIKDKQIINGLNALENQVKALSGKKLDVDFSEKLIDAINQFKDQYNR